MDQSARRGARSPAAMVKTALALHRQSRSNAALQILERIPAESLDGDARRLLGIICTKMGNLDGAVRALEAIPAGERRPEDDQILADCLVARGDPARAQTILEDLLVRVPGFDSARRSLARALAKRGLATLAVREIEAYLATAPGDSAALRDLGQFKLDAGDSAGAVAVLTGSVDRNPTDPLALSLLARACGRSGDVEGGDRYWARTIALVTDNVTFWREAILARRARGNPEEALQLARQALESLPDEPELLSLRCFMAIQARHYDEARAYLEDMKARDIMSSSDWNNLASAYEDIGRGADAIQYYRKAVEVSPGHRNAHSNLVFCLNYVQSVGGVVLRREHEAWARKFAPAHDRPPHTNRRDPDKRLRVGYVSRDFNGHVISYFLRPLLENFDHSAFELFGYCNLPAEDEDHFTEIYKKLFDRWRSVAHVSNGDLAEQIEADGIDILVDLSGHTAGHRLEVFARRPAPVQVTWLGYPSTTGLSAIDYRISDAVADPLNHAEDFNTETLWHLPDSFLCYKPNVNAPACLEAPCDARGGVVTFGCFNKLNKVTDEMLHSWARILSRVPQSRLFLKAKGLAGEAARGWVNDVMADHGITADRLTLVGQTASYTDHAKLFADLDIALDPHPYSGTTSTCEALWASVPVITLVGERHASRVSASIMGAMGLGELVANNRERYEDLAVALAEDKPRLRELHATIRERMTNSPLLDHARYARSMETAFREMWRRWCAQGDGA